jgi:AcrR family transcriptional regulator
MNPRDNKTDKPPKQTPNLERVRVVTVALELLNEVGYEGLTLRRLADKLGVKAAALYWHFENKQDLIDQVAIRIISDEFKNGSHAAADYEALTWQELLYGMGMSMRKGLMSYRDGAQVLANADLSKARNFEGRHVMHERLLDKGFTLEQIIYAMFTIGRYTLGCVFEEQADPRTRSEAKRDYNHYRAEAFKDHPRILNEFSKLDTAKIMDPETSYKQGLDFIIAGIGVTIGKQN